MQEYFVNNVPNRMPAIHSTDNVPEKSNENRKFVELDLFEKIQLGQNISDQVEKPVVSEIANILGKHGIKNAKGIP